MPEKEESMTSAKIDLIIHNSLSASSLFEVYIF